MILNVTLTLCLCAATLTACWVVTIVATPYLRSSISRPSTVMNWSIGCRSWTTSLSNSRVNSSSSSSMSSPAQTTTGVSVQQVRVVWSSLTTNWCTVFCIVFCIISCIVFCIVLGTVFCIVFYTVLYIAFFIVLYILFCIVLCNLYCVLYCILYSTVPFSLLISITHAPPRSNLFGASPCFLPALMRLDDIIW